MRFILFILFSLVKTKNWIIFSPWFHKNTTKMDLSMKIDVQHLLKVVLKRQQTKSKIWKFQQAVNKNELKIGIKDLTSMIFVLK